jgi:hypothetical protein
MPKHNVWDYTLQHVYDMNENVLINTFSAEDILENLIEMNAELDRFNKENLGDAGMKILDMRVDIEDALDMINQTRVKMDMILFSLKTMEAHVRDNLPEFTMNYEDYKQMINETRNDITVDYSEMVTDED